MCVVVDVGNKTGRRESTRAPTKSCSECCLRPPPEPIGADRHDVSLFRRWFEEGYGELPPALTEGGKNDDKKKKEKAGDTIHVLVRDMAGPLKPTTLSR